MHFIDGYNPGMPVEIKFKSTWLDANGAEPAYGGSMEEIDRIGDRVLLYNPLSGHYWDERPDHHGRFIVEARNDRDAVRIFRERRW